MEGPGDQLPKKGKGLLGRGSHLVCATLLALMINSGCEGPNQPHQNKQHHVAGQEVSEYGNMTREQYIHTQEYVERKLSGSKLDFCTLPADLQRDYICRIGPIENDTLSPYQMIYFTKAEFEIWLYPLVGNDVDDWMVELALLVKYDPVSGDPYITPSDLENLKEKVMADTNR